MSASLVGSEMCIRDRLTRESRSVFRVGRLTQNTRSNSRAALTTTAGLALASMSDPDRLAQQSPPGGA
eukprot:8122433-Alexandrium_andersonii.AAC.1